MSMLDILGITRIYHAGVEALTRKGINFLGSVTVEDDPVNGRTNVTIGGGGGGGGAIGTTIVIAVDGAVTNMEIPNVAAVRVVMCTSGDAGATIESILPPPTAGDPAPSDWHSVFLVNYSLYPISLLTEGTGVYGSQLVTSDGEDYVLAPYQGVLLSYLHYVAAWTVHPLG